MHGSLRPQTKVMADAVVSDLWYVALAAWCARLRWKRTDEGCSEDDKGSLAHTHERSAYKQAPESPGEAASENRQEPDQQADPNQLERLDSGTEVHENWGRHKQACHEGSRKAAIFKVRKIECSLHATRPSLCRTEDGSSSKDRPSNQVDRHSALWYGWRKCSRVISHAEV